MVGVEHEAGGDLLGQRQFDRQGRGAGGKAGAVTDAKKMGVHGNGRLLEPDIEDHICGLPTDAGQSFECLAIVGHFAAMQVDQHLGERKDVLGLAAIKADGLDVFGDPFHPERNHGGGRGGEFEEALSGLIDADIGGLGREHDGDEQRIGVEIIEFALGLGFDLVKALKNGLGVSAIKFFHFFRTWHSLDPESLPIFQGESIMPMQTSTTTSPLFSATLRPDRSLRAAGGWIGFVIASIAAFPILIAAPEFLLPGIAGFAIAGGGLTAFSLRQRRRARLMQQIVVWADQLEITTTAPGHDKQLRRFDPKKVRLLLKRDEHERTVSMHLRHGNELIEIGAFLAPADKSSFAREFGQAMRRARQA